MAAPTAVCQSTVKPTPIATHADDDRADDRDDLEDPREDAEEQPVRLAVEPEREGEQRRDEHDQQELAADERAELLVDEHPRVAGDAPVAPRHERLHEADRPVALEDPVRGDGEREEDRDEHLERRLRRSRWRGG